MSLRKPQPRMTVAEYLEMERTSEVRHEYLDGEIYAMSGASKRHNRIGNNLNLQLDRTFAQVRVKCSRLR